MKKPAAPADLEAAQPEVLTVHEDGREYTLTRLVNEQDQEAVNQFFNEYRNLRKI